MTDLLFPPWLRVSSQRVDAVSNTAAARSIFTGAVRTIARSGDRLRFGIKTDNASNRNSLFERAKLASIRTKLRGQANRIYYSPSGYSPRGSFPSPELISNNTFADGLTGWTSANASLSVADGSLRFTITNVAAANNLNVQPATNTAYAPYALRSYIVDGAQGPLVSAGPLMDDGGGTGLSNYSFTHGLMLASGVKSSTGNVQYPLIVLTGSGFMPGAYFDMPWASFSRCAQIDNGQNLLKYSEQLENAAWSQAAITITANNTGAPNGTLTAEAITETTATSTHELRQSMVVSAAANDYYFAIAIKPNARSFVQLAMEESSGATDASAFFTLVSSGSFGSIVNGANWANCRAFITTLGNGWYGLHIVARKTNAATGVLLRVLLSTDGATVSYTGSTASVAAYATQAIFAQSSVPVRYSVTTSAATTGASQNGPGFYVKGLPASTNGLLLEGDYVQIGNQLVPVAAALNSDAASLGYLQLAYPIRTAPADNDPVIVNTPMGRFILAENTGGWDESPGIFSNHDFVLEEALDT